MLAMPHVLAYMAAMLPDDKIKALRWRAQHRGTREADMMIGGFFEAHHEQWGSLDGTLFGALLNEQDVDIMAWAIGTQPAPERYRGSMMDALQRLDYIRIAK